MTALRKVLLTAAVLAAVIFFALTPRKPLATIPSPDAEKHTTVRGAFHIHTRRSDGALDRSDVAAAARRAGLQFAIFTDHGDATRAPDPPEYVDGVLCIDAVEVSTNEGHYVALGLSAAPYRLGGDADTVVEDVARLGGFGVVAHPSSVNRELAWRDWTAPVDGLEWLNADSEWRDESRVRLAAAFARYLIRPPGALVSLFDRPNDALERWDALTSRRRVIGLPGHDAHGGVGAETGRRAGRRLHVPSYEAVFRAFSLNALMEAPLTGRPVDDAAAVIEAIRRGRVFTAIDAVASPSTLDFTAQAGTTAVRMGDVLSPDGDALFSVRASVPVGAETVLLRDGAQVARAAGGSLDHVDASSGTYRVEIHVPGAPGIPPIPWLVGNPIFRRQYASPTGTPAGQAMSWSPGPWHVEHSEGSTGTPAGEGSAAALTFALAGGGEASQFAALVSDISGIPADAQTLQFRGTASRPMRVSVQVRYANSPSSRFGRSAYLDTTARAVTIPLSSLRALDREGSPPALSSATSLLFVVDLVNAKPGDSGSFALQAVGFTR